MSVIAFGYDEKSQSH